MPWKKLEKTYVFDGLDGKKTLSDLFDDRRQLTVYHFMYGSDWDEGCQSCSYLADDFDPAIVHLNHRDVTVIAVSTAPLGQLETFKKRMGWTFTWVSSSNTEFNRDLHVSFTSEEVAAGNAHYNYRSTGFPATEAPGASVFHKDGKGEIFHTYSVYGRGLDMFLTAYHYLDLVPKGRDEDSLSFTMEWLRPHDAYDV